MRAVRRPSTTKVPPALFVRGDALWVLDQRALPRHRRYVRCVTAAQVAGAISSMAVRGAPAIGLCAALGLAVVATRSAHMSPEAFMRKLRRAADRIASARPTAADLSAAVTRVLRAAEGAEPQNRADAVRQEAETLEKELRDACESIAVYGAELLEGAERVMTYCNTGVLATGVEWGTALGAVVATSRRGRKIEVWVPETRPFMQGSRLTAYELACEGIPTTVVPDSACAALMRQGSVDAVIVGADRIASNGDVANKIGTYALALAAHHHDIPFFVAAPSATFDASCPDGSAIPIEKRSGSELVEEVWGRAWRKRIDALYQAFDVTPSSYVRAIVWEGGVLRRPYEVAIQHALLRRGAGEGKQFRSFGDSRQLS